MPSYLNVSVVGIVIGKEMLSIIKNILIDKTLIGIFGYQSIVDNIGLSTNYQSWIDNTGFLIVDNIGLSINYW